MHNTYDNHEAAEIAEMMSQVIDEQALFAGADEDK